VSVELQVQAGLSSGNENWAPSGQKVRRTPVILNTAVGCLMQKPKWGLTMLMQWSSMSLLH